MNKRLFSLAVAIVIASISASAENDTTVVKTNANLIKFEVEHYTSDKGKELTEYTCTIDGETYPTNKTTKERTETILRFGGSPCIVKITNKRYPNGRITTL